MAPDTMFAWQYTATSPSMVQNLHFETEIPTPQLPAKKPAMRVRVLRASINPVDYKVPEIPIFGRFVAGAPPRTPAMDYVGRVEESKLPGFETNDLVVGKLDVFKRNGALGQFVVVEDGEAVAKIDEAATRKSVDESGQETDVLSQLACIGIAGSTALRSIEDLKPGSKVFINGGSGGTGAFGIQLAKARGLNVVTTCSPRNFPLVKALGTDDVIDYTSMPVKCMADTLHENATATGQMFDRAVDNVGNAELFKLSHLFLVPGARYVMVGVKPSAGFFLSLIAARILPTFLGGGKRSLDMITIVPTSKDLETISTLVLEGKVRVPMEEFKLEDAPKAYEMLKTGRTRGKIVVKVAEE